MNKDCPKCTCKGGPYMQDLGMWAATAHSNECAIWQKWYYEIHLPADLERRKDDLYDPTIPKLEGWNI